ncbi:hypothetical protein HV346_10455 [Enterobacter sp. RHBSTW-00994]|uniref:transposase domain-containing protein n=1 Tax=Enterobacter sp. RHBSTW-00994 TaxID=2742676 RepID=UPI0015EAFAE7|nr:transposase domain-containing protein [Enterobacter sp. RHBSTW-00994]QLR43070.1 hypothetical protein HV346_10455 [Enterobacter sp. RHBSTW-00994]
MELYQAPGIINATTPERARSLADLIPPALIQQALTLTDTVTLRKRKAGADITDRPESLSRQ